MGCAVIVLLRRSLSAALRAVHRATERRRTLSRRGIPVVLVRRVAMCDAGFGLEARVLGGGGAGVVVASPKFHSTAPLRGDGCRTVHRAWHVRGLWRRALLQASACHAPHRSAPRGLDTAGALLLSAGFLVAKSALHSALRRCTTARRAADSDRRSNKTTVHPKPRVHLTARGHASNKNYTMVARPLVTRTRASDAASHASSDQPAGLIRRWQFAAAHAA